MPQRSLLYGLTLMLALASCHKRAPAQPPASNTLAVTTHLEGITAPCGCTSRPLGGLDRIAHVIEHEGLPYVIVGNTYMTERAPTAAMTGYVRTTAQIVARIIARLKPVATATGPWDVGPMAASLETLPSDLRMALELGGPVGEGHALAQLPRPSRTLRLGDATVGLMAAPALSPDVAPEPGGLSKANATAFNSQDAGSQEQAKNAGAPSFDVATLNQEAKRLRAQGAQGVFLLWPHGTGQARALLGELEGVDAVFAGSEEAPQPAEGLGSATLFDGGARGEYLGKITLHAGNDGPISYFDGGQAERAALEARRHRFVQEAQRLEDGPAKEARLNRAEELEAQIAAIASEPPAYRYLTWELMPMDQHLPQTPWATEALMGYNKALCDSAMADTAARTCTPAPHSASTYVGTATCQACHQQAYDVWSRTAHSRAWATLENAGKTCDLSCVGCHVVGFEQPGGFCHLAEAEPFHNVGCESCHGPGLGHVQNPNHPTAWASTFVRNTPEATCRGCHNSQHSDQFNFETYRPRILGPGHGAPL